jgi:hypothetical protein
MKKKDSMTIWVQQGWVQSRDPKHLATEKPFLLLPTSALISTDPYKPFASGLLAWNNFRFARHPLTT